MKKSHFKFTKGQRSGIFLLLLIILIMQSLYYFVDFSSKDIPINKDELIVFQNEIDSLRLVEIEAQQSKIFPFNPNYITDYKGYTLGMLPEEIDRLLKFREQNKWVNSTKQFQEVTKVSDSLLNAISPYFKFPEWVTNPKPKASFKYQNDTPKTFIQKIDLNTATAKQLQGINGIGEKLSDRIIKFRNKFEGGFIDDVQLQDVYGISLEVMERLLNEFTVKTPRQIKKIRLNSTSIEQLVTIQHIDYEIAYEILDQRILREGFKSLDDLTKVKGFPVDKIEIIKLYLTLN
ncbi:helix-hairpin-helix domain-containing protein [Pontimicrobium sp. SW4]|uniref:Helix-hairpin-helix domain-containing protein n=1 Tax=Pontimicrobium sp. SW4 TaxID=3153519 RepID=A0AAU7BUE9_9FLAO